MEDKEFQKKLDVILQKRRNCVALTDEEEKFALEAVNKLLDGKKTVRKSFEVKTGEQIRKGNMPAPIREHSTPDQKEEKLPTEDTSGKIEGEYTQEEYADTDEIPYDPHYEEDRLADILEGKKHYANSIRVKSLVTKSLANGNKLVGQVIKVYKADNFGNQAVMVKWSNGSFEHVNVKTVEVLKAEKPFPPKKEEEKPTDEKKPFVKPEDKEEKPTEEVPEEPKDFSVSKDAPHDFIEEVVKTLTETTDLSREEIVAMAKTVWAEIFAAGSQPKPTEKE